MKSALSVILFLIFSYVSLAQQTANKPIHAIGIEAGKLGPVLNAVYDLKLPNNKMGFRAVIGTAFDRYLNVFQTGVGAYYLIGNKKHSLETGFDLFFYQSSEVSDDQLGLGFLFPVKNASSLYTSGNLGYRYTGKKNILRAGLSQGYIHQLKNYYTGGYISFSFLLQ